MEMDVKITIAATGTDEMTDASTGVLRGRVKVPPGKRAGGR